MLQRETNTEAQLMCYSLNHDLENTINYEALELTSYTLAGVLPQVPHRISNKDNNEQNIYNRTLGKKQYELSDHLGNVRATVSDRLFIDTDGNFYPQLLSSNTYYPFGMGINSLSQSGDYRFGFGGHEKDDEIAGSGNHLSFGDYGYDPRLGRRWRPDPLQTGMPSWSPYAYAIDNPIVFVDEDGKWPGVTYMFFELDAGLGLCYGLNYVEQSGLAYDEVGKTHFTMTSALYIVNQDIEEGSRNPEIVDGISASLSGGITQDWSNETFISEILLTIMVKWEDSKYMR